MCTSLMKKKIDLKIQKYRKRASKGKTIQQLHSEVQRNTLTPNVSRNFRAFLEKSVAHVTFKDKLGWEKQKMKWAVNGRIDL